MKSRFLILAIVIFSLNTALLAQKEPQDSLPTPSPAPFSGHFNEPGFAVNFLDAIVCPDSGVLFVGRFDDGGYDVHSKIYGYDSDKYPEYVKAGFFHSPVTIVHKINSKGDSLWTKLYPFSYEGSNIVSCPDGGYVIAGFKSVERPRAYKNDRGQIITLLKIDEKGKVIWFEQILSDYNSTPDDMLCMPNGDIFILSEREYAPISDFELNPRQIRLVKVNSKGKTIWDKTLEIKLPMTRDEDFYEFNRSSPSYGASHFMLDKEGVLCIAGYEQNQKKAVFARCDTTGNLIKAQTYQWEKSKYSEEWNWGCGLVESDSGYIFSSTAYYNKADVNRLVKINKNLDTLWVKLQAADNIDESYLCSDNQDGFWFVNDTDDNLAIVAHYDKAGNKLFESVIADSNLFEGGKALLLKNGKVLIFGSKHTHGISDWQGVFYIY